MNAYKIYKHEYCKDVVFEPWSLTWKLGPDEHIPTFSWYIHVTGAWFNIAHERMFFMTSDKIVIKYKDLRRWKEYKHAQMG